MYAHYTEWKTIRLSRETYDKLSRLTVRLADCRCECGGAFARKRGKRWIFCRRCAHIYGRMTQRCILADRAREVMSQL